MRRLWRLSASLACATTVALSATAVAGAAAPRIMMVTGPKLERPVFMTDWGENLRFMTEVVKSPQVRKSVVRGRPTPLTLSLFWGPEWNDYIESGRPLNRLKPKDANQHGRFYPAIGSRPPVVDLVANGVRVPRRATADVLRILSAHGVPIRR